MATYTNVKRLGIGGFGEVWKARRSSDTKLVAKKVLKTSAGADAILRFAKEVRMLSKLDHSNVVKVLGSRLKEPPFFFVMPLYKHSLADILEDVVNDEKRIVPIFTAILDGMEYAHGEGVLHRDLKPGNILMNNDHDVVVCDFGLGRDLKSKSERQTQTGGRGGTKFYWPPEQQTDFKRASIHSDVYTLGRMLYELYTGPLTSYHQDLTALPGQIAFIINKCTQAALAKRFASVTDLKEVWIQATDQEADVSPEGEVEELVARLVASEEPDNDDIKQLMALLQSNSADNDLIHNTVMKLPAAILKEMYKEDAVATQELIELFVDYTTAQGWGFSYTDKIGNHCVRVYNAIKDYRVRADLTYCVLQVGVNHSRWQVQGQAEQLIVAAKLSGESLALVERLKSAGHSIIMWLREKIPVSKRGKVLQTFLTQKRKSDSE